LINRDETKLKDVMSFYKSQFPKSWFISVMEAIPFNPFRLTLLNSKYFVGSVIQKLKLKQ